MSPLGDNHLRFTRAARKHREQQAAPHSPSLKYVDFNALTAQLNDLNHQARTAFARERSSVEVKETIARVNDLLGPQNRANLAATIANARECLKKTVLKSRPHSQRERRQRETATPLEIFRKTSEQANQTLNQSMPWWARIARTSAKPS